jgi:hypothetical protein
MEWFINGQAFLRSYVLAHPFSHLPSVSSTDVTQEDWERETNRWEGGGRDAGVAESYDHKEACPSTNHSYALLCTLHATEIWTIYRKCMACSDREYRTCRFSTSSVKPWLVLTAVMYSVTNTQHNLYYTSCKRLYKIHFGGFNFVLFRFSKGFKRRMLLAK